MSDETTPPSAPAEPAAVPDAPADRLPVAASPLTAASSAAPPSLVEPPLAEGAQPGLDAADDDLVDDEVVGFEAVPALGRAGMVGAEPSPVKPASADSPVLAPLDPAAAPATAAPPPDAVPVVAPVPVAPAEAAPAAQPAVIYVAPPVPPHPKHNRGFAFGIMLLSSLAFALVFGAINAGLLGLQSTPSNYVDHLEHFAQQRTFFVPVVAYLVLSILLGLLLNRAGAVAHSVTSLALGILVYAGSVGVELLAQQFWTLDALPRLALIEQLLTTAPLIIAGAVARETAQWFGFIQARRGRRVRERNEQAKADFEAEQAGVVSDVG